MESEQWKEPTDDQKKIVALTAQLEQLKKSNKSNRRNNSNRNRNNNNNNRSGNDKSNEIGNNQSSSKKTPWYWQPPKEGEPQSKKIKDKTYYWCPNHGKTGKWVRHQPKDCKATGQTQNVDKDKDKDKPNLQVNSLAAVMDEDDF